MCFANKRTGLEIPRTQGKATHDLLAIPVHKTKMENPKPTSPRTGIRLNSPYPYGYTPSTTQTHVLTRMRTHHTYIHTYICKNSFTETTRAKMSRRQRWRWKRLDERKWTETHSSTRLPTGKSKKQHDKFSFLLTYYFSEMKINACDLSR